MEKRTVNLKFNDDIEGRKLEGYASVFSDEYTEIFDRWGDSFGERIVAGAFRETLKQRSGDIFMLINHDYNKVVGRNGSNLTLEEDNNGLRFSIDVPNTSDGNDLLENVRVGIIRGCSFGFSITEEETRWLEDKFYRDITKVDLYEITATPIPAYANTEISARSDISLRDIKPKVEVEIQEVEKEEIKKNRNKDIFKKILKKLNKER